MGENRKTDLCVHTCTELGLLNIFGIKGSEERESSHTHVSFALRVHLSPPGLKPNLDGSSLDTG